MTQPRPSDTVAASIRDMRQLMGWTMADLAEHSGLSRDVISDIENGRRDRDGNRRRDITIDEMYAIAWAFGYSEISLRTDPAEVAFRDRSPRTEKRMIDVAEAEAARRQEHLAHMEIRAQQLEARMEQARDELVQARNAITESRALLKEQEELIARLRRGR